MVAAQPQPDLADLISDLEPAACSDRERTAWQWPDPIPPSQWAERHRELEENEADQPGPWRNANAPYLRGIMDLSVKPGVERIVVEKAAQIGVSEASRILLGYWAHYDPSPVGLALPDKVQGEKIVNDKIKPVFQKTPVLKKLLTTRAHDVKKQQITLANGFTLYLMWSGSPAATAAFPMKRAITDEANKHQPWRGESVDPVDSVDKRQRTYSDKMHWLVSTPTTRHGKISVEFDACPVRLYFLVACPHCGVRQRMVWPQFEFPSAGEDENSDEHAYRVICDGLCVYRCAACDEAIDEKQRRQMVKGGAWGTVGEDSVLADGRIDDAESVESWPRGTRIAMQVAAFYCLWPSMSLSEIAAEFIRAKHDPVALFTFRTETCGERWEQQQGKVKANVFADKSERSPRGDSVLPWWTDRVIITVDTQKEYFWAVVRAWGPGMLSARVWHGKLYSFAEIEQLMDQPWPYEDQWLPPRTCYLLLIDSGGSTDSEESEVGSRTQEVYQWSEKHKARVRPIKGVGKPRSDRQLYWAGQGIYQDPERRQKGKRNREVRLWNLDVNQCQDLLAEMIQSEAKLIQPSTGEEQSVEQWQLSAVSDGEYNRHMANLHQIVEKDGSELIERWVPVSDGARVDYRDCEGYQIAAAYMAGIHRLPNAAEWAKQAKSQAEAPKRKRTKGGITTPDGRAYLATHRS